MEEVKWRITSGVLAITLNLGLEGLTISHVEPLRLSSWLAAFVGLAFFLYQEILRGPEESWPRAEEMELLSVVSAGCGACVEHSGVFPGCGRRIQMRREAERGVRCLTQEPSPLLK